MSSSFELSRTSQRVDRSEWRRRSQTACQHDQPAPVQMARYLPLSVITTGLVIVLPAMLASVLVPRGNPLLIAVSVGAAVAASVALAGAAGALWTRQSRSRDLVFSELLLWGWLRRCWTERRLAQARDLHAAARRAGPAVSVELLASLGRLLDARETCRDGHSQRVARHAEGIARAMRLPKAEIKRIRTAAAAHDVGKLHTPVEILANEKPLSDDERAVMNRHAAAGGNMLAVAGDLELAAMVRHHHERVDGGGYPDGLAGSEIPLGARIIAVADTFDAITSSRPYRQAASQKHALDVLSKEAGFQLDSVAVATFLRGCSARRPVAWVAFATAVSERILGLQSASASLGASLAGSTSMLPAMCAAGLLTLTPAFHRHAPVDTSTFPGPVLTQPSRSALATAAAADPERHDAAPARNTQAAAAHPRWNRTSVHVPLVTSAASDPTAGSSYTPATTAAGAGRPGRAPGASSPPAESSRTPTSPAVTLPGNVVPTLPAPAVEAPITVPSVRTPRVSVPSVSTPSISTPVVTVPSIKVPAVTVPALETPAVRLP